MPLLPGKDQATFKENVSEAMTSFKQKGSFGNSGPISPPKDAQKRILAAAYAKQRQSK